jgi:hypothetical protein
MNEVARHLLMCELLDQLPPTASSSLVRQHLWAAFEWQRSLSLDDTPTRHQAQRLICARLFFALRDMLNAVPLGVNQQPLDVLKTSYGLPTFLALTERLVTQMVFASGCVGNCFPPLLPSRYVATYLAPRTSLVSPYLLFGDNKNVGDEHFLNVFDMVLSLLQAGSLLDAWASIGQERGTLQAVQAACRVRCYVLLATVLLNRVSMGWENRRISMLTLALELDGGPARGTWAKAHVE